MKKIDEILNRLKVEIEEFEKTGTGVPARIDLARQIVGDLEGVKTETVSSHVRDVKPGPEVERKKVGSYKRSKK